MFFEKHFDFFGIIRNEVGIRHIKDLIEKAGFAQVCGLYLAYGESI